MEEKEMIPYKEARVQTQSLVRMVTTSSLAMQELILYSAVVETRCMVEKEMTIFMAVLTLTFFLADQDTTSLIVARELTLLETLILKRIQQLVTAKYWGSPSIFVPHPLGSYFFKKLLSWHKLCRFERNK